MMEFCRLGYHFTRYRTDLVDARKRHGKAHLGYTSGQRVSAIDAL